MSSCIDCGMHLVFHGIVAHTVVKMEEFVKDHGMSQQFERLSNHYLKDIQSVQLDWCKKKTTNKNAVVSQKRIGFFLV